ncbi:MAG: M6 family metalloprotease domain-containing protein [Bacteroidales bacterium]|nr:M6 family metalloprotease domain-containing protein [Bacteroidales bacterium]
MKRILTIFAALILTASWAHAVPANPKPFKYTQPDGSVITLTLHGDEYYHWTTDSNGRIVEKGADGFYRPASHDFQARRRGIQRRRSDWSKRAVSPILTTGERHIPVVLVEFSNLSFTISSPKAKFNAMLNLAGYSANGGTGSVKDYYVDNSNGAFTPVFDVFDPVTLSDTYEHYGKVGDERGQDISGEALLEALALLDSKVDFSKYDADKDGYIDMILMYYAGHNEAEGGGEYTIWPHQGYVSATSRLDGLYPSRYFCTSELKGSEGSDMCGIGTTCHEFAHSLGLPDFYDTDYEENGTNHALYVFSLMSSGSYLNSGCTPPYLNAEERIMLGWMDSDAMPEVPAGSVSISSVKDNVAYKSLTSTEGEYFVYEYRQKTGWDNYLPSGMLIYHVDKSKTRSVGGSMPFTLWEYWDYTNIINAYGEHPCFYVVAAKDPSNLNYQCEYINDFVFPGTGSVTSYTPIDWDGEDTGLNISNIRNSNSRITFTASYNIQRKLTGTVSDKNGMPLSGVKVSISDAAANVQTSGIIKPRAVLSTTTDYNGEYSLDLSSYNGGNQAYVTFSLNGYISKTESVTLGDRTTRLSVALFQPGESEEHEIYYYDPSAQGYGVGLAQPEIMAAMKLQAQDLQSYVGDKLSAVKFIINASSINKLALVIDIDGIREYTFQLNVTSGGEIRADLSEYNIVIPEGKDIYIGYAVNCNNNYPMYIYPSNGYNNAFYNASYDLEDTSWYPAGNYELAMSAFITKTYSDDPDEPIVELPALAKLGFSYIDTEGATWAAKEKLQLKIVAAEGKTVKSAEWKLNGGKYSAEYITLVSGEFKLTADVVYTDGTTETLELEYNIP